MVAYRISNYRLVAEVKVGAPISFCDILWRPTTHQGYSGHGTCDKWSENKNRAEA